MTVGDSLAMTDGMLARNDIRFLDSLCSLEMTECDSLEMTDGMLPRNNIRFLDSLCSLEMTVGDSLAMTDDDSLEMAVGSLLERHLDFSTRFARSK